MIDARLRHEHAREVLTTFEQKVERAVKLVQGKVALDIFTGCIKRSPVDTGRFRANWMLTIGESPSTDYDALAGGTSKRPSSARGSRGAGAESATRLTDMKLGQTVWITNNTPYGIVLEAGHSDQAPEGIVLTTVLSVVDRTRRALKGGVSV